VLQIGGPVLLSDAEIDTVLGKFGSYGQQPAQVGERPVRRGRQS
jgi:hypothetical protein